MSVGRKIAERRASLGITQAELANRVGSAQEHISRLESGVYVPRINLLKKLADVFGCKIEDLI